MQPNIGGRQSRIHLQHNVIAIGRIIVEYHVDAHVTRRSRQGIERVLRQFVGAAGQFRGQRVVATTICKATVTRDQLAARGQHDAVAHAAQSGRTYGRTRVELLKTPAARRPSLSSPANRRQSSGPSNKRVSSDPTPSTGFRTAG